MLTFVSPFWETTWTETLELELLAPPPDETLTDWLEWLLEELETDTDPEELRAEVNEPPLPPLDFLSPLTSTDPPSVVCSTVMLPPSTVTVAPSTVTVAPSATTSPLTMTWSPSTTTVVF